MLERVDAVAVGVASGFRRILVHVTCRGHVAAEARVTVIRRRPRHREADVFQGRHRQSLAIHVLDGERNFGSLPCQVVGYAGDMDVDTGYQRVRIGRKCLRRIEFHRMGTQDGGIERRLAFRNVAVSALRIVRLEAAWVIGATGEIDIVMAGTASCSRRAAVTGPGATDPCTQRSNNSRVSVSASACSPAKRANARSWY